MMFLLRAAFWLAIVSVFVPREFAGEAMELPLDFETAQFDAAEPVSEWCSENETLCEAGEETVRLGGFLADAAIARLETVIEEHNESEDS